MTNDLAAPFSRMRKFASTFLPSVRALVRSTQHRAAAHPVGLNERVRCALGVIRIRTPLIRPMSLMFLRASVLLISQITAFLAACRETA